MNGLDCCAVIEYDGLVGSTPEYVLTRLFHERFVKEDGFAYVIFTDLNKAKYGDKLLKYIKKHNLGPMTSPRKRKNPNSSNQVKLYVWSVDERNLKLWAKKHARSEYHDYQARLIEDRRWG